MDIRLDGRIELVERLDDSDSAVRYWVVTGLMSYDMDKTSQEN